MLSVSPSLGSRNPFRVLKTHRNFRIFWIGQTLSLIGSWMQTMALGWLSLELSNSAFVVGLVASVGAIPIVLFSMHAGAFVDRSDRLRLVRITQAVFLVDALVLATVNWLGLVTIPLLLFLAFVQGICSAVEIPARQSMIIQLVGRDDLQPAIALNSSGFNLARVIGPAIGGLVIHRFGIAWCFALNAVSYLAVLWGLLRIRLPSGDVVDTVGNVESNARRAREAFREARVLYLPSDAGSNQKRDAVRLQLHDLGQCALQANLRISRILKRTLCRTAPIQLDIDRHTR